VTLPGQSREPDVNVNSRYLVEGIDIRGAGSRKLSHEVSDEIQRRIGQNYSPDAMNDLARRIRKELRAHRVIPKVVRGAQAERVKVIFEVTLDREEESDYDLSKFVYHSKQAWSAKAFGDLDLGPNAALLVGIASDSDDLLERYAGIGGGFEARKVGTRRLRLGFLFENYHHLWNRATTEGIYRTRRSFQPALTVVLADPLKLTVGASFHQLEMQYPAARDESANTAVAALRYHQRFRSAAGERQEVRASYEVRSAARTLDSDLVYTRHQWTAAYKIGGPKQTVVASFTGGRLTGQAPLFERYSLGNSRTLRGWSKFEVAPHGGDRMAHNTLEYRRRLDGGTDLVAFYDIGAVWNRGAAAEAKHAIGFGVRTWRFQTALGFPVRSGRMAPMFLAGVYFTEDAGF
jgi:outer membrane translocation and assembly module TamA